MKRSSQLFFWVFTLSVFLVLIVPVLVQDGMFMDGMLYACVSKNLSQGIGTFWFPHYSSTLYPFFDQQPPLGFGIQSLFFTCLGDGLYVERLYSFLCAVFTALLIVGTWRFIFREEKEIKKIGWLPVLFWISIPVCFWSYANNVLENTMAIFDLAAIFFILKYLLRSLRLIDLLIAGSFVFMASMTKGIQGTFPLAAVFLGWLVYRPFSFGKMVQASLVLLAVPVLLYTIILQNAQAYTGLTTYLQHRVFNSIQHVSEVESRFYLVGRLFQELLPIIILTGIFVILYHFGRKKQGSGFVLKHKKHMLFFVLVGISASFPLMITLEQRGFYLTTSLPYYAIAIALVPAAALGEITARIHYRSPMAKRVTFLSFVTLAGVLVYSGLQIGKNSRDTEMLHDTYLIGDVVPDGTVVGSTDALWRDWALQEYLVRHHYICMADTILPAHTFIVVRQAADLPAGTKAQKVDIPTIKYHLYKKAD